MMADMGSLVVQHEGSVVGPAVTATVRRRATTYVVHVAPRMTFDVIHRLAGVEFSCGVRGPKKVVIAPFIAEIDGSMSRRDDHTTALVPVDLMEHDVGQTAPR